LRHFSHHVQLLEKIGAFELVFCIFFIWGNDGEDDLGGDDGGWCASDEMRSKKKKKKKKKGISLCF